MYNPVRVEVSSGEGGTRGKSSLHYIVMVMQFHFGSLEHLMLKCPFFLSDLYDGIQSPPNLIKEHSNELDTLFTAN